MLFRRVSPTTDCYRPRKPWHGWAHRFLRDRRARRNPPKPLDHVLFRAAHIVTHDR